MPRDRRPRIWPVLLCASWWTACEGTADPPTPPADTPAAAPAAEPPAAPAAPPGFDAALARGVVSPSSDDATYRVDPFVATLVYERLRADIAPFGWVDADGAAPAGYQVGPVSDLGVFALLGLRSGDVVEAVNGGSLKTAEQVELALDAAENRVTVTIFREDLSFTNSYRFEGGLAWRDVIAGDAAPEPEAEAQAALVQPEEPQEPEEPKAQPAAARPSAPKMPDGGSRSPRTPRRPSSTPRPPAPTSSDIRCASAASCTITKRRFDDLRSSPSTLQRGVEIVPAIRNDVFSGYKLKRVTAGSPVHQLGFRSDDKITHINGRDLTDDGQAMALYWSLGSSKVFKVRFERGGRKQVKTVRVV